MHIFVPYNLQIKPKKHHKVDWSHPPPLGKCTNQSRKKCCEQFGFRADPAPPTFGQSPSWNRFFLQDGFPNVAYYSITLNFVIYSLVFLTDPV